MTLRWLDRGRARCAQLGQCLQLFTIKNNRQQYYRRLMSQLAVVHQPGALGDRISQLRALVLRNHSYGIFLAQLWLGLLVWAMHVYPRGGIWIDDCVVQRLHCVSSSVAKECEEIPVYWLESRERTLTEEVKIWPCFAAARISPEVFCP